MAILHVCKGCLDNQKKKKQKKNQFIYIIIFKLTYFVYTIKNYKIPRLENPKNFS